VVINVVLPAMLGLVLVRETSVISSSDELEGLGHKSTELLRVRSFNFDHVGDVMISRSWSGLRLR